MIPAIIVEDEKRNLNLLKNLLAEYCPEVNLVGEASSVKSGVEVIKKTNPALLFLDIELSDGNAFELLEQTLEKRFQVIFTTAYDHYAIKAIKFSAIDYLLKPINFQELKAAVEKAKSKTSDMVLSNNINFLLKNIETPSDKKPEKIALPTLEGHLFVNIKDIVRLEADGNYTFIYLLGKERLLISRTLKDFESFLSNEEFIRVHHSHLVNIRHVKKYLKGSGGQIVMNDGSTVEVSVRKKDDFLRVMKIR